MKKILILSGLSLLVALAVREICIRDRSHISTDVLLEKKPFFGMRKLLPTEITAQVIPVVAV